MTTLGARRFFVTSILTVPIWVSAIISLNFGAKAATTVTWDSDTTTTGAQDGSGTWSVGGATWWNGSADVATTNDINTNIAQFGNGGTLASPAIVNVGTQSINGLVFATTTTNGYTLTNTAASTLTIGGSGITMNNGAQATTVGDSNLSLALGAGQTWTNNSTTNALIVGGNVTNGTFTLTTNGSGAINISGNIGSGLGGLTKSGAGTTTLSGTNNYTGLTTVSAGTLKLDYTTNNTSKVSTASVLTLATGANLTFNGNASAATTQNIDGLAITGSGVATMTLATQAGQTLTVDFTANGGAFSRAIGASLNVVTSGSGTPQVKLGLAANTTVVPWATYNTTVFAGTDASGFLKAASTANTTTTALGSWVTGSTQYTTTGSAFTGSVGTVAIDGITFNDVAARTVAITAANTVTLNQGVIVTAAVGANLSTISGGSLQGSASTGVVNLLNNNVSGNLSISSAIQDNGATATSLAKYGPGTAMLSGNNTYTGGTTVGGSTLTLDYTTNNTSKVSATSALTLVGGANLTFNGNASAATSQNIGGLALTGLGLSTMTLATQTGQTLAVDFTANGGTFSRANGPTLDVVTTGSGTSQVKLGLSANTAVVPWATYNTTVFAGTDASGFLKSASTANTTTTALGSWTTGSTQYTTTGSAFTGSVGTVAIDGITFKDGAVRTVAITAGNTLTLNQGVIVTAAVGNNTSTISGGSLQGSASTGVVNLLNNDASNGLTISSVIQDNGSTATSLAKYGPGLLSLTGANTFTGGITVGGGVLSVNSGANTTNNLGTGAITVQSGGTLNLQSSRSLPTLGALTINGAGAGGQPGALIAGGNLSFCSVTFASITLGSDSTIGAVAGGNGVGFGGPVHLGAFTLTLSPNVNAGQVTLSGVISGTGGLVQNNTVGTIGTTTLSGANTYTGPTTVTAGTLQAGIVTVGGASPTSGAFGVNSTTTVSTGATLDLKGFTETLGSISGGGTITSSAAGTPSLTVGGDNSSPTFAGVIQNGSATSVALTKIGTGSQTLAGANTYTGATTISKGTLIVSGSLSGTTNVNVASGATLASGATGSITTAAAGGVTVGGTLAPGNAGTVGTLTLAVGTGGLNFAAGSTLAIDISGASSDQVSFSSAGNWLLGSGNVTLSLSGLGGLGDPDYSNTYTLFSNVTTSGFNVAGITGYDTTDYQANFAQVGNAYQLSFTAIPEPGTRASLFGGLGLLLGWQRRQRTRKS